MMTSFWLLFPIITLSISLLHVGTGVEYRCSMLLVMKFPAEALKQHRENFFLYVSDKGPSIMALPAVEFLKEGYKLRKVFA